MRNNGTSKNNRREGFYSDIDLLKRILIFLGLVIAAFSLYHRDTILGEWKFRTLCDLDGGALF